MGKVELTPFKCPVCGDGTLVDVEIEESAIKEAKRLPAMVTTKCKRDHQLVIFVDGKFHVRDVEAAVKAAESDAIDKTKDWLSSL
ncbi:MAG: hypothetical protein BAJATHORv1_60033 [Candidatus Thorarchaeota archaeon]|nr:MAG: hypothetical protein BAJATHORv1_60033 [Candidatus Thorarchaeota archaeon]